MAVQRLDLVTKAVQEAVDDAVGQVEESVKGLIKDTYNEVVKRSPFITYYYRSNHRILVKDSRGRFKSGGGGGEAKLFPAVKPDDAQPGQFAGNVSDTTNEELDKLNAFELGDVVTIRTNVPYADEVETKHMVYAGARIVAENS